MDTTTRLMINGGGRFPAVIGQNRLGEYGFWTGAIPTELEGKKYKCAGDAVYDFIRCAAAKTGSITAFQIEQDGHVSKPYRQNKEGNWVID